MNEEFQENNINFSKDVLRRDGKNHHVQEGDRTSRVAKTSYGRQTYGKVVQSRIQRDFGLVAMSYKVNQDITEYLESKRIIL